MVSRRSSTSKKRVTVGIIVGIVIVVLAGIVLWVSHTPRPSQDIALAVAKTVYSNNARAFQGLWPNNLHKAGFVYQVSQRVQKYGPVKEVVLMSNDRALQVLSPHGIGTNDITSLLDQVAGARQMICIGCWATCYLMHDSFTKGGKWR